MRIGPRTKLLSAALIAGCLLVASPLAKAETALLAVASNFAEVAMKLGDEFKKESGHTLKISTGATGQLYAQIKHGAPFDVFLSADEERPRKLDDEGLIVAGSRFTYAVGQLVWWSPKSTGNCDNLTQCIGGEIATIAIANPKLAPYGRAAEQVLRKQPGWPDLKSRLVYGQNIAQTFAMVATGNADSGIVARAQADPLNETTKGSVLALDSTLHEPIRQDVVLLKRAKDNPAAVAFMAYLKSPQAREVITSFGYLAGDD